MSISLQQWVVVVLGLLAADRALLAQTAGNEREVKRLLSDRCFTCHGPDASNRAAGLRLDRSDAALAARTDDGRKVISRGDPERSELFRRITSTDPAYRMPPPESKLSMSEAEIRTIERWIEGGAEWEDRHWSFVPLAETNVPASGDGWARGPIDRFTHARLEAEPLAPAAEASREQLIRRVTFDLTGLPPTIAEVNAFLADKRPGAYERLVDGLLARPAYGERMTQTWLDVARYSDTFGYQVDRNRHVWPWRDWVVDAFNRNLPYDEFITQQLAGDLLPPASDPQETDQQILATTFNRLHPQKVEGGSVPEEFRVEYVADRTHTVATAFLGLTFECCRCHDHKYDPLAQKEYYQLFAFFNSVDEAGLYSYFTNSTPTPTLRMTSAETKKKIAEAKAAVDTAEAALAEERANSRGRYNKWVRAHWPRPETLKLEVTGQVEHQDFESYKGSNQSTEGVSGKAVTLTGDDGIGLKTGNFSRYQPFSVALWMKMPPAAAKKERVVVFHRSRAWTDSASRGYQFLLENGVGSASLIHFWPGNAIRVRTKDKLPVDEWFHLAMTWDGSSRAKGLRLWLNGEPAPSVIYRDNLYKNITGSGGDKITIGQRFRDTGFAGGSVDEFRVFDRELSGLEVAEVHAKGALLQGYTARTAQHIVDGTKQSAKEFERKRKREEERQRLADAFAKYYRSAIDSGLKAKRDALRAAREKHAKLLDGLTEIMVMEELSAPRKTHLLKRGAYDAPGEEVHADTPAALPPMPQGAPRNRLGFAQWLTAPEHPLTARVAVNRFWQMAFGRGLVGTPEDFGSQGALPTHPALLDWLAKDFMDHGWDVKRLWKQMVTSTTYRQTSRASLELHARDPDNELLARGPSHQLDAEMIRDGALAASGLLVEKVGGAPAKPYDLEVSFKPMGRDKGDGLYRRSLYTFWKRTGPAPVMMTLDAAKRDVCMVKRERTTTPLQACVLLNGPQFVEAARVLGERLAKRHVDDDQALLTELFRTLTSRTPDARELGVLENLFHTERKAFEKEPNRAEEFLKTGDAKRIDAKLPATRVAAAGVVANLLMGFDECVMKR